jgi:hypothetical protein
MKSVIVVALSTLLAIAIASCLITDRSQNFACTSTSMCATGRTCVAGFCVEGNGVPMDAPVVIDGMMITPDSPESSCPPACTTCDITHMTCTIDCKTSGTCGSAVTCPTGYACNIECNGPGACRSGVDCTNATACEIECSGDLSCSGIECGSGACDVSCSGSDSCRVGTQTTGVDCMSSCDCVVSCTGAESCVDVTCPTGCETGTLPTGCEDTSPDCTSTCQ